MIADTARQVAALPYRTGAHGGVEVMLITSRDTKRWVIPKGNLKRRFNLHEGAADEAFEEAGISGIPCPAALGEYVYEKRLANGGLRPTTVSVFPLAVTRQAEAWPELGQRECRWFSLAEAADSVDEPELQEMIRNFVVPALGDGQWKKGLLRLRRAAGEKIRIVRWFQALMPKQGHFFEQFEAHAETLVAAADSLAKLLQGDGDPGQHISDIQSQEHEADEVIREMLSDLHRIFITPFDRTAMTSLIGVMDDTVDQMNAAAKTIQLYGIKDFTPQMRDMGGIIVEAARLTQEAMPLLRSVGRNSSRLNTLTGRLVQIEGHADGIHEQGLKLLLAKHGKADPMAFIIGREIYSYLEGVVDRFEDVANEIQSLVLDHA